MLLVWLILGLSACALIPPPAAQSQGDQGHLIHVVLIWLQEPGNPDHRADIIAAAQDLAQIPGVEDLRVGRVVSSDRAVVEDSYDVGLMLRFRGPEQLRAYLEHPVHLSTVKARFVPLMARYQVLDFALP